MENFQRKELITRRSIKYTYYVSNSKGSTAPSPALLFLHGFPDSAHLWAGVIDKLADLSDRIIVPDCLGYAGTDKPTDTNLYAYKDQAEDLADILDSENIDDAIIIGHDWGSVLAQRTYLHKSHLFSGVVLVNIGYMVPSDEPFDLAVFNSYTEKNIGYPQFSYWNFFAAPDAADIIEKNLERMWQALHGDVEGWMRMIFCAPDAMRNFLLSADQVQLKEYAKQPEWKDRFMHQFAQSGEFASALQSYKAVIRNIQHRSDATIRKENLAIKVPILFICCTEDAVCKPELMDAAKQQGLVPHLEEITIESAHWSPMEKPDEIAWHIRNFLVNVSLH
jgi:soluble epoxide hydrolase/lipid-phosphate phosphatase